MQTILGANGIIGEELAKALRSNHTEDIRLVGRSPQKVHNEDLLFTADLTDATQAAKAVEGSAVAYLTLGLPYKSKVWAQQWPLVMAHAIAACEQASCKLVYFDNTYMYGATGKLTNESASFAPNGTKGAAKAKAAHMLLDAIASQRVEAMICRAPEFYGPGKTKSITNSLIFDNMAKGKAAKVLLRDDVLRTLIYAPDASAAMALLGNTNDAFGQTWHLPCDDNRMTYKELVNKTAQIANMAPKYKVLSAPILKIASLFNNNIKEVQELLPRYAVDNLFDSSKFKNRFQEFETTTYADGIKTIVSEW